MIRKNTYILLLILFIQVLFISPVTSFDIPADSNEVYQKNTENKAGAGQTDNHVSSGSGGGHAPVLPAVEEIRAPIKLLREILPDENKSQLVNTTLKVKVEVQLTGKQLKNIQVLESIDPGLEVINISKVYIANNLFDFLKIEKAFDEPEFAEIYVKGIPTIDYKNNNIEKDLFNKTNNTFYLTKDYIPNDETTIIKDNLGEKGRLIYWYNIRAKYPGIYETKTIARTSEDYPDIDQMSTINIKEHDPQFFIDISGTKNELDSREKIRLTYNIRYLGGSKDPYLCSIFIKNNSSEYVLENGVTSYTESFQPLELKEENFMISYPKGGKYYLPDLYIQGLNEDSTPNKHTFHGESINVQGLLKKNSESINWTILLLGIIVGQIFGADLNILFKRVFKELKLFFNRFIRRLKHIKG